MDVSIIFVNYNTLQMTEDAINSVCQKTSSIEYEIIVVDNASIDGSRDYFANRKGIKYIYSNTNLGFGLANNLGVKYATGRNILFLNTDTLLINNAVEVLSDFMDNHPEVGVCGGNLFNKDGSPAVSYELRRPSIIRELDSLLGGKLIRNSADSVFNKSGQTKEVGYISGADFMTRREILDTVGGFSPLFFMYYEETELSNRIENAGYKIISVPDAQIIHIQGMSTCENKAIFNEVKFTWKVNGFWAYLKLSETNFANRIIRFLHNLEYDKKIVGSFIRNDGIDYVEKKKKAIFNDVYKKLICR